MSLKKSNPDKFLKVVKDQDKKQKPMSLGETSEKTDWRGHIESGHFLKHYTIVQDLPNGQKQALVHQPEPGHCLLPVMIEEHGFDSVYILYVNSVQNRLIYKIPAGQVNFVEWDIPEVQVDPIDILTAGK